MACPWNPIECVGLIGSQVSQGIFAQLEEWVTQGAANIIKVTVSGWITVPTPTVDGTDGAAAYLAAYTAPITYTVFFLALVFAIGRMAWTLRGEEFREILRNLIQYVLITSLGAATVTTLTSAGDSYANWILAVATGTDPGADSSALAARVVELLAVGGPTVFASLPITGPVLTLLGFLMIVSGLVQVIVMYIRSAILVLLVGLLPLAAAAALTRRGRQILDKYVVYLLAWSTFKPAAAFWQIGDRRPLTTISGLVTLIMVVFVLPMLLRLLMPLAAAMGGGGEAAGVLSAGAAVATGAVRLAGGMGSGDDNGGDNAPMAVTDATHGPSGASYTDPGMPEALTAATTDSAPNATSAGEVSPAASGSATRRSPVTGSGTSPDGAHPTGANASSAFAGASGAGSSGTAALGSGSGTAGATATGAGAAAAVPYVAAAQAGADTAHQAATALPKGAKWAAANSTGEQQ